MQCSPHNFTQPPTSWGKYSVWDVQWILNVPCISHIQACTSAHQGVFQGIRFPPSSSLHLSFISSSLFPFLPLPKPVFFFCSVFCPVGSLLPGWRGVSHTPLTAHYYLFPCFFFFLPLRTNATAHTQSCVTISTICLDNVLEEWKHQRGILSPFPATPG